MRRKRETEPPWVTAGMSRASWYRHGKPETKPSSRITQGAAAMLYAVGLRSVQRMARLQRWTPDLVEQIRAKKLTMGEAERILIARQDQAPSGTPAANAARKRRNRQARCFL